MGSHAINPPSGQTIWHNLKNLLLNKNFNWITGRKTLVKQCFTSVFLPVIQLKFSLDLQHQRSEKLLKFVNLGDNYL